MDRYKIPVEYRGRWSPAQPNSRDEQHADDGDYCHWDDVEELIKAAADVSDRLKRIMIIHPHQFGNSDREAFEALEGKL